MVEGDEVVISYPEEGDAKREEAVKACDASHEANEERANTRKRLAFTSVRSNCSLHFTTRAAIWRWCTWRQEMWENATNHLIEVLRLDRRMRGVGLSWVISTFAKKKDLETGEKFLRKALEIKPDDAWALNSLAAGSPEEGPNTKRLSNYFDREIRANPEFANPDYGKALTLAEDGQSQAAQRHAYTRLFTEAKIQDARSQPVFDGAREVCT